MNNTLVIWITNKAGKQTEGKQTDRQKDKQTDRQKDKQTDRQI